MSLVFPDAHLYTDTVALPPTIPTSFVPKQPVTASRRMRSGANLFLLVGFIFLTLSLIGAGAAFGYEKYLEGVRDSKAAALAVAEKSINVEMVEEFIRLRNRLIATETLLNQHVATSQFLDVLETRTLQTVRFASLTFHVNEDRTAEIEMSGTARSFNALAAQSSSFAAEKRIRRAVFSNITVDKDGGVAFRLTADIEPRLVIMSTVPEGEVPTDAVSLPIAPTATQLPQAQPAASTTPAASTSPKTP